MLLKTILAAAVLAATSTPGAAPQPAPAPAAGASDAGPKPDPMDAVVCRSVVPTGSIMSSRVCQTRRQWKATEGGGSGLGTGPRTSCPMVGGFPAC